MERRTASAGTGARRRTVADERPITLTTDLASGTAQPMSVFRFICTFTLASKSRLGMRVKGASYYACRSSFRCTALMVLLTAVATGVMPTPGQGRATLWAKSEQFGRVASCYQRLYGSK